MNNKLLLPAMIALLSGCATHSTTSYISGSGSGAPGLGQAPSNNIVTAEATAPVATIPAAVKPAYSMNNSEKHIDKEAGFSSPVVTNTTHQEENNVSKSKTDDADILFFPRNKSSVNKPVSNRYSDSKAKNKPLELPAHENSSSTPAPAGSAGNPSSYTLSGENYKVLPFSNGFVERGIASWYGPDFHGEKTSNGETYNMYGMTAAHKLLPIPSYIKVTNLKNKRSVVLRVNDRGPFFPDRVIDLSYAAAQKLDIHQRGTEMVQIEAIKTSNKEKVYLQLGVFSESANAQQLQKKIVENKLPQPTVKEIQVKGKTAYRVQLGPLFSNEKVNDLNAKLAKIGISETWYVTEDKL